MKRNFLFHILALFVAISISSALGLGQAAPKTGTNAHAAKRQPCWQVAGISQSAMQQRKELEQSAHSEIQSVCADTSLSQQQKREKIKEIHQQTRQKAEALITPQQQEALKSCRQERGEGKHMAGGHKGMHHGHGPCGEMASADKEKAPPEESKPQQ